MASLSKDNDYAPHLVPHKGSPLKALGAAWVTLTGVTIILRFWSRATSPKKKFGVDDWAALASWPLVATIDLLIIEWTGAGLGRHITDVPLGDVRKSLKMAYTGYIVYNVGITLIRFSAIMFYNRIFEPRSSRYRYFIWAGLGLNMAWIVAFGTLAVVQCVPVHAYWDRFLLTPSSYRCLSTLTVQLLLGITSVLMDLLVLLLPIPCLWKLHTNQRNKVRLLVIFFVGYCVIIFTVGRLVSIARAGRTLDSDSSWTFVTPMYWFSSEISIASISISLPVISHLIKRYRSHGPAALLNAREYPPSSSHSHRTEGVGRDDGFLRLTNETKNERAHELQLDGLEQGHI